MTYKQSLRIIGSEGHANRDLIAEPEGHAIRDPIAEGLKRLYDETLSEPLPQDLVALIERLKHTADD